MIYMFKVYALIAFFVFASAGALLLVLMAVDEAKQYALALQAVRHISQNISREPFVISRTTSRNDKVDSFHAA